MKQTTIILFALFLLTAVYPSKKINPNDPFIQKIQLKDTTYSLDLIIGRGKTKNSDPDFYLSSNYHSIIVDEINENEFNTFLKPIAISVDDSGNIYIADQDAKVIRVYDSMGRFIRSIGPTIHWKSQPGKELQIVKPKELEIFDNIVYVLESYLNQLRRRITRISVLDANGDLLFLLNYYDKVLRAHTFEVNQNGIYITEGATLLDTPQSKNLVYHYSHDLFFQNGFGVKKRKNVRTYDPFSKHTLDNWINIASDSSGHIYLVYRFLEKMEGYTEAGIHLSNTDYKADVKKIKYPVISKVVNKWQEKLAGNSMIGGTRVEVLFYPICNGLVFDKSGLIYLLTADDHSKNELSNLIILDNSGKYEEKVQIPVLCNRMFMDHIGNLYFLSQEETKLIFKYKRVKSSAELQQKPSGQYYSAELENILEGVGNYCQKLKKKTFNFYCQETITNGNSTTVFDYQMVQKSKRKSKVKEPFIYEQRNRKSVNGKKKYKKDVKIKAYRVQVKFPFYSSMGFFDPFWQPQFQFKIIGEDVIENKNYTIIQAIPRRPMESNYYNGKIWVDKNNFSILRVEIIPATISQIPNKLIDNIYGKQRNISCTIEFKENVDGLRYPSNKVIQEWYSDKFGQKQLTYESETKYINYIFFKVDTKIKDQIVSSQLN